MFIISSHSKVKLLHSVMKDAIDTLSVQQAGADAGHTPPPDAHMQINIFLL
jgi:hypothetical protein